MVKKFYITTAIDYVNSLPHIGTAYEKIGADVLARWHRLLGEEVHFEMGNDEHSVNVQKAAVLQGKSPKAYCDEMRVQFEKIWKGLNISYDGFIQTSDPSHEMGVQRLFKKIQANGDIYKKLYEGWYCESCEAFLTEKDLANGLCPNHKSKPRWLSEENYFFALTRYKDRLLRHIEEHPEFILPEIRRNEIMALLKEGLQDVSVSRSSFDWGIPVPGDPGHVIYVWLDALANYITAAGYGSDEARFQHLWPADIHVIGKDITRFHCVIWPAMLMSAGIPLPHTVFGHGFVYLRGEKMSKTLGNVVTPMDIVGRFGPDPLRYYLMREGGFGRDSDFTWDHFIERYNGDLANGIGNLVSRTIGMAVKYQKGSITPPSSPDPNSEIARVTALLPQRVLRSLDHTRGEIEFHNALAAIWEVLASSDKHINDNKPWEMAKAGKKEEIVMVLWEVAQALRVCTILLGAFIPETATRIWNDMGFDVIGTLGSQTYKDATLGLDSSESYNLKVKEGASLFPRIETKLSRDTEEEKKMETGSPSPYPLPTHHYNIGGQAGERAKVTPPPAAGDYFIDIADFEKSDLRVAEVVSAEKIEGADKLLKLTIRLGHETRQIVAGIAKHYTPEDLVGRQIVVVVNLRPAKLRGIESQGMLLAASDKETISILTPLKKVALGSKVK